MIQNYFSILKELELELTKRELAYIQAKSLYNFLIYYEHLQGEDIKRKVLSLFEDHFNEIKKDEYLITVEKSRELYPKNIMKIGQYYHHQLGFKACMRFEAALFVGIIIDLILLLLGLLKQLYYLPIATFLFVIYNRYLYFTYAKKNKLYGPRY